VPFVARFSTEALVLANIVSNFLNGFAIPFIPGGGDSEAPSPKIKADNVVGLEGVGNTHI
jgi:hypothetical protein